MINLLFWNCRGAGNDRFLIILREHMRIHNPDILILVETRISRRNADKAIMAIGYPNSHRVGADLMAFVVVFGCSGGEQLM